MELTVSLMSGLFIDSSRILQAVLIHNVPFAHSVRPKEEYDSVKTLFNALDYEEYGWEVIGTKWWLF